MTCHLTRHVRLASGVLLRLPLPWLVVIVGVSMMMIVIIMISLGKQVVAVTTVLVLFATTLFINIHGSRCYRHHCSWILVDHDVGVTGRVRLARHTGLLATFMSAPLGEPSWLSCFRSKAPPSEVARAWLHDLSPSEREEAKADAPNARAKLRQALTASGCAEIREDAANGYWALVRRFI